MKRTLIILTLLAAGIFTFLRAWYREPVLDDITYTYVLDEDITAPGALVKKISNLKELWSSQVNHYLYVNGRTIVHSFEQLYYICFGLRSYAFMAAIIVMLLLVCVIRYSLSERERRSPLWWVLALIALLYMFPYIHRLWFSINISSNYALPSLLMMVVLLLWRRMRQNHISNNKMWLGGIISFLLGWSHEIFSLPVAGAMTVYYFLHCREFKKSGWILAVPLWIGAILMLISPGNWIRVADLSDHSIMRMGIMYRLQFSIRSFVEIPIVWAFVITIITAKVTHKIKLQQFFRNYIWDVVIILFALGFMCITAGYNRTFTSVSLILLCFVLRLLSIMMKNLSKRNSLVLTVIFLVLLTISQLLIIRDSRKVAESQRIMIELYRKAPDATALNNVPEMPFYTRPFVTVWPILPQILSSDLFMSAEYSNYERECYMFAQEDYDIIRRKSNRSPIPGGTPFVFGKEYFWADEDSCIEGAIYEFEFYPVDFNHTSAPLLLRVKFALMPEHYPAKSEVIPDTITLGGRRMLVIPKPGLRKVKSLKVID